MVQAKSLDPAEIAKFSAIADEWWDQDGAFAPLHAMNPVRLEFIRDAAAELAPGGPARRPLQGLRVLDIGCGGGLVSVPLARLGADVTGVDASGETIAAARTHAEALGLSIDFREGAAESVEGAFDLVLALEVVEHVASVADFLSVCAARVRAGGKLIVSTINRTQRARMFAIIGAERFLKWAPEGTHAYEKLVAPEELEIAAGLSWDAPVGLSFDPLARGWKLSRDTGINYFRVARKL